MSLPTSKHHTLLEYLAIQLHRQRLDSPSIMKTALGIMNEIVCAQFVYLVVFGASNEIEDAYTLGEKDDMLSRGPWGQVLVQRLIKKIQETDSPVVIDNMQIEPEFRQVMHNLNLWQPCSALSVPMMFDDRLMGAIIFIHPAPERFDEALIVDLAEAASITGCALTNARDYERAIDVMSRQIEQERLRRDLSAMIYHDMRGPLHNIAGSLSRLERFIQDEATVASSLIHIASSSTRQMMRMIKSLLDIERLENSSFVNRKPVTLESVLLEATDLVSILAYEAEQVVSLELDDDELIVDADRDMLLRVVTNLLENAIKHTPQGGQIILSAMRAEDGVCIRVMDNGPGIPSNLQREIFDKYVRLKSSRERDGYGLGLAFCRLAVEAHGGRIWVESGPNGGTIFAFNLPVAQEALVA